MEKLEKIVKLLKQLTIEKMYTGHVKIHFFKGVPKKIEKNESITI